MVNLDCMYIFIQAVRTPNTQFPPAEDSRFLTVFLVITAGEQPWQFPANKVIRSAWSRLGSCDESHKYTLGKLSTTLYIITADY